MSAIRRHHQALPASLDDHTTKEVSLGQTDTKKREVRCLSQSWQYNAWAPQQQGMTHPKPVSPTACGHEKGAVPGLQNEETRRQGSAQTPG